jgi:hypothetical protein
MVYDYWMLCRDDKLVKDMIPGIIGVLHWFELKLDSSGMLGPMEYWNFVDWVNSKNWNSGAPPDVYDGNSSVVSLQYVYTLQRASAILEAFNMHDQSLYYSNLGERIKSAVYNNCYDKKRELIADTPEKITFSQHANIMAVLTNTFPVEFQKKVLNKINNDAGIAPCSYYYRFYLTEAMEKAGLSDLFPDMLDPWDQMLDLGLTTFAEGQEPTRSDCHAWSSSPVYFFLSLICGIKPNEPGFKSVRIEPGMGRLQWLEGSVPHRLGDIKISLKKDGDKKLIGMVTLPENLSGIFIWRGDTIKLKAGENIIQLNK